MYVHVASAGNLRPLEPPTPAAATHEELPISIFVYICLPLTFITVRLEYNSIIFIIRSEARTKEIIC